jgi:hypothetical protein
MRFMIIRRADAETEAGIMPSEQLIADMTTYNEELGAAGIIRGGEGLLPSSKGMKVKFRQGKPVITDGPFAEAKELIAGFTIIEVASREEAMDWIKRWPPSDGHGEVELEIRQIASAEDFGDAFTPELQEREAVLRAKLEGEDKSS